MRGFTSPGLSRSFVTRSEAKMGLTHYEVQRANLMIQLRRTHEGTFWERSHSKERRMIPPRRLEFTID